MMQKKSKYLQAFNKLLEYQGHLSVVIIGANDGKFNDPLYDTLIQNAKRTSVLCIEPNPFLIPHLTKNYSSHPNFHFQNCAIGQGDDLTLFAIKPEYFSAFQPNYAQSRGWPTYRAATGITSGNRKHLEKALIQENLNPDEMIEKLVVKCFNLFSVMAQAGFDKKIDVLQIDTEGFDDVVLYNSSLESTKPQLIFFENAHIPENRMTDLIAFLYEQNYRIITCGADTLAIRKRPRILDLMLRIDL